MSITSQFQSTLPVWGGTLPVRFDCGASNRFNPPSPCGEGRGIGIPYAATWLFQSTLPVWGGTFRRFLLLFCFFGFNPPSPCGEGHGFCLRPNAVTSVSIHPPRVGRDGDAVRPVLRQAKFQSTLPVWGGTFSFPLQSLKSSVSIHPPRVGRDTGYRCCLSRKNEFQSTLPVWGGTG